MVQTSTLGSRLMALKDTHLMKQNVVLGYFTISLISVAPGLCGIAALPPVCVLVGVNG